MKYLLVVLLAVMSVGCSEVVDPSEAKGKVFVPDWTNGKWQYTDEKGKTTVVTLYPDGSALADDGGIGSWFFDGDIHIVWISGWQDLIKQSGASYEKLGYAPGVATVDFPTNRSTAVKLP